MGVTNPITFSGEWFPRVVPERHWRLGWVLLLGYLASLVTASPGWILPWEVAGILWWTWQGGWFWGWKLALLIPALRTLLVSQGPVPLDLWGQTIQEAVLLLIVGHWLARRRHRWLREQQLARYDDLTRLANRPSLRRALDQELMRARRSGQPVTVLVIDCDRFKQLNDTQGHQAGDEALVLLAGALQAGLRGSDLAARWGGDEFVVVLAETGSTAATLVWKRLSRLIAEQVATRFADFTVTAGVVTFLEPPADVDACLHQADAVMYRARQRGRGETEYEVVAGPALPSWASGTEGAVSHSAPDETSKTTG